MSTLFSTLRRAAAFGTAAFALCAAAGPAFAQDLTETFTTSGGLTVAVPADAEISETSPNQISITATNGMMAVTTITVEARAPGLPFSTSSVAADNPVELVDTTVNTLTVILGDASGTTTEPVTLRNGEGAVREFSLLGAMMSMTTPVPGEAPASDSVAAAVQLENGILVLVSTNVLAMMSAPDMEAARTLTLGILESAEVAAGSQIEGEIGQAAINAASDPTTYLEPGLAVFAGGALVRFDAEQLAYTADSSEFLNDDTVTLSQAGSLNTLSMQLYTDAQSSQFGVELAAGMIAGMAGDDAFDMQNSFTTVESDAGTLRIYDSRDAGVTDAFLTAIIAILTADDERTMIYQGIVFGAEEADAMRAFVLDLAENTQFVAPADVQAIIDDVNAQMEAAGVGSMTTGAAMFESGSTVDFVACIGSLYSFPSMPNVGDTATVECPANCASNGGTVWGSGPYTSDSAICVAAVHAGYIDDAVGGSVSLVVTPGQDSYEGTTLNGVTTLSYGSWDLSYTFEADQ